HAIAAAEELGVPRSGFELQTLHGMGDVIQDALVALGHRVRVYTPYGAMLPGMAYLVRRLLENTSNESFLRASFTERSRIDDLLRNPEEIGSMLSQMRQAKARPAPAPAGLSRFRNEPVTDFGRPENRAEMAGAIEDVRSQLGKFYPLLIAGQEIQTDDRHL